MPKQLSDYLYVTPEKFYRATQKELCRFASACVAGAGGEVLSTILTGFTTGTNTPITSGDSILSGLENLQGQINAIEGATNPPNLLIAATDVSGNIVDGTSNVISRTLTGFTITNSAIAAADTILSMAGKAQGQINVRANIASPTFTGIPAAPTAAPGNNTTQLASTAFVTAAASGTNFIANGTTQQASSNFNISGAGVIGTTLNVAGNIITPSNIIATAGGPNIPQDTGVAGVQLFTNTAGNQSNIVFVDPSRTANNRLAMLQWQAGSLNLGFSQDGWSGGIYGLQISGGFAGITGITSNSGSGQWVHTGDINLSGGTISRTLSAAINASTLASPTNTGVYIMAAANYADINMYDATQAVNARSFDIINFQNKIQFRLKNDAGSNVVVPISFDGGFAGYTGISSNSGTGSWVHTGSMSVSALAGTGTRMVVADDTGILSTQALPLGVATLNGLNADTQTFAVDTIGTDFNISSASSTHTFSIPDASASARGLVTNTTQAFGGFKTFSTGILTTTILNNFYLPGANVLISVTNAVWALAGSATTMLRVGFGGGITSTVAGVNSNVASVVFGKSLVTEAASGTHPVISNISVLAPTITNGAATTTIAASLYIDAAPTGGVSNWASYTATGDTFLGGRLALFATNTAGGTTGDQVINKPSGTVNIAAAGTTVTVTNSTVTTSSIVFAVIRTNDSTATIKNVVPAAGSFVINLSAATTAETSIGFMVIN